MTKIYKLIITIFFWSILFLVGWYSLFCTCYVTMDENEITLFVSDSIAANVLCIIITIGLFCIANKSSSLKKLFDTINHNDALFTGIRRSLLLIIAALGLFFVISTRYVPRADQYYVQEAVYALRMHDYSMFAKGGYMATYPDQTGQVLICYLFSFIVGTRNYLCYQLVNAAGVALIYWALSEIWGELGFSHSEQLLCVLTGILFFPLIMYSSFVYGNILGLAFSLLAIHQELLCFKSSGKRRILNASLSILAIIAAVLFKKNYLIFLIGIAIAAVVEACRARKAWILGYSVLILVMTVSAISVPKKIAENMTGEQLEGSSSLAWIAMGLQDGPRAPGWYNGFNKTSYEESGFDSRKQAEFAKESIRESLDYFAGHREEAIQFFTLKTASQWVNPTFQSFWIQHNHSLIEQSDWIKDFLGKDGEHLSVIFLKRILCIVYFGSLLFCLLHFKDAGYASSLILALIFVGGFVFHLAWEAKAQYTISYFVLLFPYAVSGYKSLTRVIGTRSSTIMGKRVLIVLIGLCILIASLYAGGRADILARDSQYYNGEYLEELAPDIM